MAWLAGLSDVARQAEAGRLEEVGEAVREAVKNQLLVLATQVGPLLSRWCGEVGVGSTGGLGG